MLRLSISYQSKPLRQPWFSLLLGLVAAALISGSISIYLESNNYVQNGTLVSGKVIRLVETGKRQYSPEIQITKKSGRIASFTPNTSSSDPSYQINQTIGVLYLSESGDDYKVNDFFNLWSASLVLALMAAAFFAVAIITWVFRKQIYTMTGNADLIENP